MLHLTLTGLYAGTYFCGGFTATLGAGSTGTRASEDRGVHYAYAPVGVLTDPDLCPACLTALQHAAFQDAETA